MIFTIPAFSQCRVDILSGGINTDSIFICSGQEVLLSASGENVLIMEDFNLSSLGLDWSYCSPNAGFNAPCDPLNTNPYLWFGALCPVDRILETKSLDLALGGLVEFDLKFALQNGAIGCEGPDEMLEGISLQYSIDSGITWADITYFCPNGSFLPSNPWVQSPLTMFPTQFTSWNTYSFQIPALAMTSHTRLRWIQESSSYFNGHYDDNWGLDNIRVSRSIFQEIHWGDGSTTAALPPVFPQQTTIYYVYIINFWNPADTLCQDSFTVVVHPSPMTEITGDTIICSGDSSSISASGPYAFVWSTGATGAGLLVSPSFTSSYMVTATNGFGCEAVQQTEVKVLSLPEGVAHGDSVCPGDTAFLWAEGGVNYYWNNGIASNQQQFVPEATAVYSVTISGANGCMAIDSTIVRLMSPPQATITPDMVICYGDKAHLVAGGGNFYQWSTGAVKQDIFVEPFVESTYTVTVSDANSCTDEASTTIYVNPFHEVELLSTNDTICRGSSAILRASGGSHYEWNTGRADPEITVFPEFPTLYSVDVSDEYMNTWCHIIKQIEIQVEECEHFYFPNAISPKGYNPVFKPIGEYQKISKYSLFIYDRWGNVVFQTHNPDEGWNGTLNGDYVAGGTYVYCVNFNKTIDGYPYNRTGTVTVVY